MVLRIGIAIAIGNVRAVDTAEERVGEFVDTAEGNPLAFLQFRNIEEDGLGIAHRFFDERIEKGMVGLGVVGCEKDGGIRFGEVTKVEVRCDGFGLRA